MIIEIKRYLVLLLLIISPILSAFSQADKQLIEVANEMYSFGSIRDALEIYKQAIEANPSNAYAHYMVGKCYLETIHKENSLPFLLKAFEIDREISFDIKYLIATAYQISYDFDNAAKWFNIYKEKILNERDDDKHNSKDELRKIKRHLAECENAKELVASPVNVALENLGKFVNSEFQDYGPAITENENMLFFTSRRSGSTGGNKDNDNMFFEDIYVSYKKDGEWSEAINIGNVINSNLHEASIGISADGKMLFIYKDNDKYVGDIFFCKLDEKGNWSKPKPLSSNINTKYIENSISISYDGKTLFFSSNRPGGKGGMDIYMSKLEKNGSWGIPVNLGDPINTDLDDESPYISKDGKSIYFSSRGHKGMGGFDIYRSYYDTVSQKWTEPENLGYPVNSPDDDVYFISSGENSDYGYYASHKNDGLGDMDLYRIYLNGKKEKADSSMENNITSKKNVDTTNNITAVAKSHDVRPVVFKLNVLGDNESSPLEASIHITDRNHKNVYIGIIHKNGFTYKFTDSSPHEYNISIEKEGYVYKSLPLSIPAASSEEKTVEKTITLSKINAGTKVILRNIYYNFDHHSLKETSYPELNKLYLFLKKNPSVKIQIVGHTDSKGSAEYNNNLSLKRAESVKSYLISKGLDNGRISAKGEGKSHPLASNDDEEEGRELNRRTEFEILSK